ncbi:ld-carboxypeptidase [Lucifera butyrica]|uniref:Ld-carboxypeptidase n=1 Tax=Lucifera butyrica TaxID=1351585 RepID=A0A498RDE3_9FIRM|nr:LD-carboxypeptidase [Lucifera butyrica]VBB08985.1 ld-carboxypeptidase [Lucifera butyrica]
MDLIHRLKPKRLRPGDTLGIVAPASPGDRELAMAGIHWLEEIDFQVRPGLSVEQTLGYLSGTDEVRAADINAMFASPEIDGIICLRGGYGTMRLLELLDYDLIRAHPKVFVGYSDITALLLSISQRTGLVTFHGPMVASDMGKGVSDYTRDSFFRAVSGFEPPGPVTNPPFTLPPAFITPGAAQGCLTGGNLSLIAATLGTPYEIDTCGKILFLEDVGEAPYRIDRMLTHLLLAGKLQAAAGIVVDIFAGCDAESEPPSFTVQEVLEDRLYKLNIPVLYNLYFGHTADKVTLPIGVMAVLDSQAGGLEIMETAISD